MPHPQDNSALDEIRAFEFEQGRTAQRAEDAIIIAEQNAAFAALRAEFEQYKLDHPDEDPDPDPDPEPGSLAEKVKGTWVLQQVGSVQELDRLRGQILEAAAWPGITGISIRFPWDAADITGNATSHPLLVAIKALGEEAGKPVSIRFMAGAHTPTRVFESGAAFYMKGGLRVPLPWSNTSGDHTVFLAAYQTYARKLADWARANSVSLLHLSWWGQDWAELNHGKELRDAPGYTQDKWLAGAKGLIDVAPNVIGDGLAVELPLSGYGPLSGGQSAAIADHILTKINEHADEFFVQANGLGPNGEWGAPSGEVERQFDAIWQKAVARGVQMIQPQDYDWADIYANARGAKATYVEVYLPSFRLAHAQQLKAEIAAFAANPS